MTKHFRKHAFISLGCRSLMSAAEAPSLWECSLLCGATANGAQGVPSATGLLEYLVGAGVRLPETINTTDFAHPAKGIGMTPETIL